MIQVFIENSNNTDTLRLVKVYSLEKIGYK